MVISGSFSNDPGMHMDIIIDFHQLVPKLCLSSDLYHSHEACDFITLQYDVTYKTYLNILINTDLNFPSPVIKFSVPQV